MSRRKIIAGNWKMYKNQAEAITLTSGIAAYMQQNTPKADVWIAPPFLYIAKLINQFGKAGITVGAQDCSVHDEGAYTGEISAAMLQAVHAGFSIVGHSERRAYHGEDDTLIAQKINALLRNDLIAMYCCGETLQERESGNHLYVVEKQMREALFGLSEDALDKVVIAYEPVWAIGTGVTASPLQAQEMHAFIRSLIRNHFGGEAAAGIRIVYGGSVKPGNAAELFQQPDIDGGLVGGASLVAEDFFAIISAV